MKGKVALHNLGCKVNAYETEAMQQMLEAAGYEIVVEHGEQQGHTSSCIIVSCAVMAVSRMASAEDDSVSALLECS